MKLIKHVPCSGKTLDIDARIRTGVQLDDPARNPHNTGLLTLVLAHQPASLKFMVYGRLVCHCVPIIKLIADT